jgi:hypothetical protein
MCRNFYCRLDQAAVKFILILPVAALFAACAAERPERQQDYLRPDGPAVRTLSVPFDSGARRDRVELRPDETLVVRLESRGGPSYQWELAPDEPDPDVVSVVNEPRPTYPPPGGSVAPEPKWDVFTFRTHRPGATTLKFVHVLLTESDAPPNKRSEVRVDVKQ